MLERMWSKVNTIAGGSANFYSHFGNHVVVSQKIGTQSTSRYSNTTLGPIPKGSHSYHKDICSTVFIATLFVIAWKQPRHPSTEEWIKKMWYIYTMEYYSAVKNNGIRKFEGKGMELEKIILSEVAQTWKDQHGMYSLISGY